MNEKKNCEDYCDRKCRVVIIVICGIFVDCRMLGLDRRYVGGFWVVELLDWLVNFEFLGEGRFFRIGGRIARYK